MIQEKVCHASDCFLAPLCKFHVDQPSAVNRMHFYPPRTGENCDYYTPREEVKS